MSQAAAQGAGQMIKQLVQLSLMELAGGHRHCDPARALRDRIRGYVAQHLRDPGLSVDGIARALNCSRRHPVQRVLPARASPIAAIQRVRLRACVRDLQIARAGAPLPTSPCPGVRQPVTSAGCSASAPAAHQQVPQFVTQAGQALIDNRSGRRLRIFRSARENSVHHSSQKSSAPKSGRCVSISHTAWWLYGWSDLVFTHIIFCTSPGRNTASDQSHGLTFDGSPPPAWSGRPDLQQAD